MRSLQNDRSVVIKPTYKGSAVVVWDRTDYLKEAERQLSDEKTYEEIRITEKDQAELVNLFFNISRKKVIIENENNSFRLDLKKQPIYVNFMYFLRPLQDTWTTSHL